MEYKKAIEIYQRMCDSYDHHNCTQCKMSHQQNTKGVSCIDLLYQHPDIVEQILTEWDEEHPKRTILSEFLKCYPNAPIGDDGTPNGICPRDLGYTEIENCMDDYKGICIRCWERTPEEATPANES